MRDEQQVTLQARTGEGRSRRWAVIDGIPTPEQARNETEIVLPLPVLRVAGCPEEGQPEREVKLRPCLENALQAMSSVAGRLRVIAPEIADEELSSEVRQDGDLLAALCPPTRRALEAAPVVGPADEGLRHALAEIAGFTHTGIESLKDAENVARAALDTRPALPVDEPNERALAVVMLEAMARLPNDGLAAYWTLNGEALSGVVDRLDLDPADYAVPALPADPLRVAALEIIAARWRTHGPKLPSAPAWVTGLLREALAARGNDD